MTKQRILTGDRPTNDAFHLGNYVGSLANRVRLQEEYDAFFLLADLHVLTTRTQDLHELGHNIRGLTLDYSASASTPRRLPSTSSPSCQRCPSSSSSSPCWWGSPASSAFLP